MIGGRGAGVVNLDALSGSLHVALRKSGRSTVFSLAWNLVACLRIEWREYCKHVHSTLSKATLTNENLPVLLKDASLKWSFAATKGNPNLAAAFYQCMELFSDQDWEDFASYL